MKKIFIILCSILTLTSISVEAAENKSDNSPWYVGFTTGFITAKGLSGAAINWGLDIGYRNNKYLSTEIQSTSTIIEGGNLTQEWSVDTFSAFAAFRTNSMDKSKVKLKTKIGLTHMNKAGINDTNVSYGIGIGKEFDSWMKGRHMYEIEFTMFGNGVGYIDIKTIILF